MTARKQLTNKERVQRKHMRAYCFRSVFGEWCVYANDKHGIIGRGPTPALAWAAAERVM